MKDLESTVVSTLPSTPKLPDSQTFLRTPFDLNIGDTKLQPEYWQAIVILGLVFVLVISAARYRHLYVKWNMKSYLPSVAFGFILAIILEGFMILGGRTLFTEILGWDNAPKPISTALDEGRNKLVKVLGTQANEIPDSVASELPTSQSVIEDFNLLTDDEANEVKTNICSPEN
ncbi:hypothetical protein IPM62_04990 [Candidatus Woesebacteria bacterium]|nr:MAG: hypothetical protein IPM62_04990 [Candidatus Woesebacteria bacterium]